MNSCEYIAYISALACSLSENRSNHDITYLASFLTQLGSTLGAIAVHNELNNPETEAETPVDEEEFL